MPSVVEEFFQEGFQEGFKKGFREGFREGRSKERSRSIRSLLKYNTADSLLHDDQFRELAITQKEIDAVQARTGA